MRAIALNLFLLIFLVPFSGCTSPALEEDESNPCSGLDNNPKLFPRVTEYCVTQEVEGELINRRFLIQAPSVVNESASYPLLFVLGGIPDEFVGQFRDMTDAGEFVGVYPEGLERSWNLGREASNANDTEFLEMVADSLLQLDNLDHKRRYIIGYSNGAGMAHTLGKESNYFSAFVAVITSLTTENIPNNDSGNPSVMQILGAEDEEVPYEGGEGVMGHVFLSGDESARVWAEHNQCGLNGENTTLSDGSIRTVYSGCINEGRVVNYKVANSGHGIDRNFEGGLNSLMWDFLSSTPVDYSV